MRPTLVPGIVVGRGSMRVALWHSLEEVAVSFRESVSICMRKFGDFNGRARRAEFWWFYLFLQLVAFVSIGVPYIILIFALIVESSGSSGSDPEFTGGMLVALLLLGLGVLVNFVFTIPFLAVSARRLHDTGQSGHWLWFHLAGLGIVPLIMCIMEGQPHANQWGEDPKAAERWNAGYSTYPPQAPAPTPWPGQPPAPGGSAQPPAGQAQPLNPAPVNPAPLNPAPQNPAPQDPFATPPQ